MTTLGTPIAPAAGRRGRCDIAGVSILLGALGASVAIWAALVLVVLMVMG